MQTCDAVSATFLHVCHLQYTKQQQHRTIQENDYMVTQNRSPPLQQQQQHNTAGHQYINMPSEQQPDSILTQVDPTLSFCDTFIDNMISSAVPKLHILHSNSTIMSAIQKSPQEGDLPPKTLHYQQGITPRSIS